MSELKTILKTHDTKKLRNLISVSNKVIRQKISDELKVERKKFSLEIAEKRKEQKLLKLIKIEKGSKRNDIINLMVKHKKHFEDVKKGDFDENAPKVKKPKPAPKEKAPTHKMTDGSTMEGKTHKPIGKTLHKVSDSDIADLGRRKKKPTKAPMTITKADGTIKVLNKKGSQPKNTNFNKSSGNYLDDKNYNKKNDDDIKPSKAKKITSKPQQPAQQAKVIKGKDRKPLTAIKFKASTPPPKKLVENAVAPVSKNKSTLELYRERRAKELVADKGKIINKLSSASFVKKEAFKKYMNLEYMDGYTLEEQLDTYTTFEELNKDILNNFSARKYLNDRDDDDKILMSVLFPENYLRFIDVVKDPTGLKKQEIKERKQKEKEQEQKGVDERREKRKQKKAEEV